MLMQVGSIVNFSLMYFLAPTVGTSAAAGGLIQTLFSDRILRAWGAPGERQLCMLLHYIELLTGCCRCLLADAGSMLGDFCMHSMHIQIPDCVLLHLDAWRLSVTSVT